jgi:hypothetical protein
VTRLSSAFVRDKGLRQLIITVVDSYVEIRCKGLRSRETMDISAIYGMALKSRMAMEKAQRKAARKGKGK